MTPKIYVGTIGMSVWFSPDGGDRWERPYSESGLYMESRVWALSADRDLTLRAAALVAGIREVAAAMESRGFYP